MVFEMPPEITCYYLRKKKCDVIQKYIKESGKIFNFEGEETPHGSYKIKIAYNSKKSIPVSEIKTHYKNLLDLVIGAEKEFD